MKFLETLILIVPLLFQPTVKEEIDFLKVKGENQYTRFDKAKEQKKPVCFVLGEVLTYDEYNANKDKYVFIFFPTPEKHVTDHFNMKTGIILTQYSDLHKGPIEISRHTTFPKAQSVGTPLYLGPINQSYYYNVRPNCSTGNCPTR